MLCRQINHCTMPSLGSLTVICLKWLMMSNTLFRGLSPKSLHMLDFFFYLFFPLHTEIFCSRCTLFCTTVVTKQNINKKWLFSNRFPKQSPFSLIGQTDNSTLNSLHWLSWCSCCQAGRDAQANSVCTFLGWINLQITCCILI